jgi:hypothetical protein
VFENKIGQISVKRGDAIKGEKEGERGTRSKESGVIE